MELRQLRYVVAVARHGQFTTAAAAVGVAQPAVSQQVQTLERELGVVLFERGGRQVRLTAAGEVFLARAERILAETDSLVAEMEEFGGLTRGRLIIGAVPSLAGRLMPPLLAGFRAQHPGIELAMREASSATLLAWLTAHDLDVALVHYAEPATTGGDLQFEPVVTEALMAVMAPTHHLAGVTSLPMVRLRDEPLLVSQPGSGIRQTVLYACAAAGFVPCIAFESSGVTTLRALAAAGLGMAILPQSEAMIAGPAVAVAPLVEPSLSRTVALAWPARRYQSAATRAFLAYAREQLHREQGKESQERSRERTGRR